MFQMHFPGTPIPKKKPKTYMKERLLACDVIAKKGRGFEVLKEDPVVFPCHVKDINMEIISHLVSAPFGEHHIFMVCKKLYEFWKTCDLWNMLLARKFGSKITIFGPRTRDEALIRLRNTYFTFRHQNPFIYWGSCVRLSIKTGADEIYFRLMGSEINNLGHIPDNRFCHKCGRVHAVGNKFSPPPRGGGFGPGETGEASGDENLMKEWYKNVTGSIVGNRALGAWRVYRYTQELVAKIPKYIIHSILNSLILGIIPAEPSRLFVDIRLCILFENISETDQASYEHWTAHDILPLIKSSTLFSYAEKYFKIEPAETQDVYSKCMLTACRFGSEKRVKYLIPLIHQAKVEALHWVEFLKEAQTEEIATILLNSHEYNNLENVLVEILTTAAFWTTLLAVRGRGIILNDIRIRKRIFNKWVSTAKDHLLLDVFLDVLPEEGLAGIDMHPFTIVSNSLEWVEKCIVHGINISPTTAARIMRLDYVLLFIKLGVEFPNPASTFLNVACRHDSIELYDMSFVGRGSKIKEFRKYVVTCIKNVSVNVLRRLLLRTTTGTPYIPRLHMLIEDEIPSEIIENQEWNKMAENAALMISIFYSFGMLTKKDIYRMSLKTENKAFKRHLSEEGVLDSSLPFF